MYQADMQETNDTLYSSRHGVAHHMEACAGRAAFTCYKHEVRVLTTNVVLSITGSVASLNDQQTFELSAKYISFVSQEYSMQYRWIVSVSRFCLDKQKVRNAPVL